MSTANSYKTRPGPDFDKFGNAVLTSLRQRGKKLTPENIESEAERLAEMLVLDEQELTERAKEICREDVEEVDEDAETIGNIYEGDS
jgi:uncharacterized membrane protein YccC